MISLPSLNSLPEGYEFGAKYQGRAGTDCWYVCREDGKSCIANIRPDYDMDEDEVLEILECADWN